MSGPPEKRRHGDLAVFEAGEGDAVVFLHGIPTHGHLWRNVAPLLAMHARVIVPDLLGYGDSAKPAWGLTVREQAGHVRKLLADLGVGRYAVVGHDIGGGVAQLLALEGGPEAMVLMDSIAFDSWPVEGVRRLQDVPADRWDAEMAGNVIAAAFAAGMAKRELAPEDLEEYARAWRGEPLAAARAFGAIDGEGLVGTEDALAALEIPVFVLWGEEDPYQPAAIAERLGDLLPGATTALLPGVSHYLTEDAPETVGPLVAQWLRTVFLGVGAHAGGPAPVDLGISFERPSGPPGDLPDE